VDWGDRPRLPLHNSRARPGAAFARQLEMARDGLSDLIHTREARPTRCRCSKPIGRRRSRAAFPCFSEGPADAEQPWVSAPAQFFGIITFPKATTCAPACARRSGALLIETTRRIWRPFLAPAKRKRARVMCSKQPKVA